MSSGRIFLLAGSYLLGAIPFGFIIAQSFYHVDIRQQGSGNTGATNVWRVLGKKPGSITLSLDILKGVIPVVLARRFFPADMGIAMAAGFISIVGHNWSIFLKGSGGKGVATSAGVFLALVPLQGVIAIVTFLLFFLTMRRVSVGSIAAAIALMVSVLVTDTPPLLRGLVIAAGIMVLIKHVPNMKRLAKGQEPKVNF